MKVGEFKKVRARLLAEFGPGAQAAVNELIAEYKAVPKDERDQNVFVARTLEMSQRLHQQLSSIIEEGYITDDMDVEEAMEIREARCADILDNLAREKKYLSLWDQLVPPLLRISGTSMETPAASGTSTSNPKLQPSTDGVSETPTP